MMNKSIVNTPIQIVTLKDILYFVIPGHLTKNDQMFRKKYFLVIFLFLGDRLGLVCYFVNVSTPKMYIWVPPYSKIHFCHSGTKFHISWLPGNIGLEMSNILVNSDAQYIWGFQIAFNR